MGKSTYLRVRKKKGEVKTRKMLAVLVMVILAMVAVPAFACGGNGCSESGTIPNSSYVLDSASFAGVMGISQGVSTTTATATNNAEAQVKYSSDPTAYTMATSTGTTQSDFTGSGTVMAIEFGAGLAVYSNNGAQGQVSGVFNPLAAGSVATFSVNW